MSEKKFKVYKSSAGSGKTFTLVREFLHLVIRNPNKYRHILAITFTNKAANEMKSRIVDTLIALTKPVKEWPGAIKIMVAPIREEAGMSDQQIRERAQIVIENILHNYSDLSATTIDSFMQRVIRTFSTDLNLPRHYEVELETNLLRQRAVDRLIDQAGQDKELTGLLVHYLETKTEDDKSWRIENDLNDAAKSLFREDGVQHRDALKAMEYADYRDYYSRILNWIAQFENQLSQMGKAAFKLLSDHGLEIPDFSYGKSGAIGYYLKLADGQVVEVANPKTRILTAVNEGAWTTKNQTQQKQETISSIAPQLIDLFEKSQELVQAEIKRFLTFKLLLKHLYPMAVLGRIERIIEEIREEERILPISEFNRIIAGVTQNETVPYIYERLGEKYHHLMIDEFQDTSVLQWQNLLPLVENSLSENHLCLVVGDAKQAIYRWRSGEVDQFIVLPQLYGDQTPVNQLREQTLVNQHEGRVLPVNWRSHKAIVEFNNEFFKHLSGRMAQPYASVYDELNQQYNPAKSQGMVQVGFFDPTDNPSQAMLEYLPDLINELISLNYKLSDIALLCRTNKQGSQVARHLLVNGIRVISSDSLLLGYAGTVRLVINLLRIMADGTDQAAYVEALTLLCQQGVFEPLSINDAILQVMLPKSSTHAKKYFNLHAFESLLQQHGIDFSRGKLLHFPLYDLAEEIIRLLNLSVQKDIYLQFFLNELHRVITRKSLTIKDLLAWWEEKGKNVSVIFPDSLDAVKVMTIHKAKGLEFPVVILPFATGTMRLTVDNAWVSMDDDLLEKLKTARFPVKSLGGTFYENIKTVENDKSLLDMVNLLYVAFTRAEERLYVLTNLVEPQDQDKNTVPAFICDFIRHNDPEYSISLDEPWIYARSAEIVREPAVDFVQDSFFQITENTPKLRWQQKVMTSTRSHKQWYEEEPNTATGFGTVIHKLLAGIRMARDVPAVMESFLLSGELPDDEVQRVNETLNAIIRHPGLQQFFTGNKNVLSEPEILLPDGEIFRPDRVLLGVESIEVAEFKTGRKQDSHKNQLQRYLGIIQEINKLKVKGFLVYASDGECQVEELQ